MAVRVGWTLTKRGHIALFLAEYNGATEECPECGGPVWVWQGRYVLHEDWRSKPRLCFASNMPAGPEP